MKITRGQDVKRQDTGALLLTSANKQQQKNCNPPPPLPLKKQKQKTNKTKNTKYVYCNVKGPDNRAHFKINCIKLISQLGEELCIEVQKKKVQILNPKYLNFSYYTSL